MREACTRNLGDEGITDIEPQLARLEELFDLTVDDELATMEERNLPAEAGARRA